MLAEEVEQRITILLERETSKGRTRRK